MYPRDQPTPGTPSKNLVKALALAREDGAFRKPLRAVVERNSGAVCSTMPPSLQETRLAEKLTVLETLALFSSFYRRGQEPRVVLALGGSLLEPNSHSAGALLPQRPQT